MCCRYTKLAWSLESDSNQHKLVYKTRALSLCYLGTISGVGESRTRILRLQVWCLPIGRRPHDETTDLTIVSVARLFDFWIFLCLFTIYYYHCLVLFSVARTTHTHFTVASLVFAQLASESTPFAILHRHLRLIRGALTSIEHESPISTHAPTGAICRFFICSSVS